MTGEAQEPRRAVTPQILCLLPCEGIDMRPVGIVAGGAGHFAQFIERQVGRDRKGGNHIHGMGKTGHAMAGSTDLSCRFCQSPRFFRSHGLMAASAVLSLCAEIVGVEPTGLRRVCPVVDERQLQHHEGEKANCQAPVSKKMHAAPPASVTPFSAVPLSHWRNVFP